MTSPKYTTWINTTVAFLTRDVGVWVLTIPWILVQWFVVALLGVTTIGMGQRVAMLSRYPNLLIPLLVADSPWRALRAVFRVYRFLLGLPDPILALGIFFALLSWGVRSFVAGGVIHRALPREGGLPRWQESVHVGLERGLHIFLIDVIFALPLFPVLIVLLYSSGRVLTMLGSPGDMSAFWWFVGSLCVMLPFFFLWGILSMFLRPLMYQACVQEHVPFWTAVWRGIHVALSHVGPTILLGIVAFGVSVVNSILTRLITLPVGLVGPKARGLQVLVLQVLWLGMSLMVVLLYTAQMVFVLTLYAQAWPQLSQDARGS